jgi:hypothetical protein
LISLLFGWYDWFCHRVSYTVIYTGSIIRGDYWVFIRLALPILAA